jgi:hypothetical protein
MGRILDIRKFSKVRNFDIWATDRNWFYEARYCSYIICTESCTARRLKRLLRKTEGHLCHNTLLASLLVVNDMKVLLLLPLLSLCRRWKIVVR